jgi:hypothetical protein
VAQWSSRTRAVPLASLTLIILRSVMITPP